MRVGLTGGQHDGVSSLVFRSLPFRGRSCAVRSKSQAWSLVQEVNRRCLPVVEMHGVRLADHASDESSEGDSSGGERELHGGRK